MKKEDVLKNEQFRNLFATMEYAPTVFGLYFFPHMFNKPFASFHNHLINFFLKSKVSITIAKMPRGFGKSTIVSFLLVIWLVFIKKAKYILLIGKIQDSADALLDDVKKALMNPRFVEIFGNVIGTKWNSEHAHIYCPDWGIDAVIASKSIDTHLRGTKKGSRRIDYAIIDDPEDDTETENPKILAKRVTWVSKVLEPALTENDEDGFSGKIWWLGTPIAEDCVVNRVAKYDDIKLITYPALVDTAAIAKILNVKMGCSIWEDKFTTEFLLKKREHLFKRNEPETWWAEYMVSPRGSKDITFRGSNNYFINDEVIELEVPMCLAIDLAYGEARKHDKAAGAIGGFAHTRKLYQFGSVRFSKDPETFLEQIVGVMKYYASIERPIIRIGMESLAFKMYKMVVRNKIFDELDVYPIITELKHKNVPKVNRIQRLIPYHQDGSFLIKRNMDVLIEQMDRFPDFKGGIDDLDASAYLLDLAFKPAAKKEKKVDNRGYIAKDIERRYREEAAKEAKSRSRRGHISRSGRGGLSRVM